MSIDISKRDASKMAEPKPAVIVTGSSGLIGTAVCHRLAGRYRVLGFDRPGPPDPPDAAEQVHCDLSSDDEVREALAHVYAETAGRLASVVHLAAYYSFTGEDSPLYDKVTVGGTARLLAGLRQFVRVEQFLFSSTMLVHAPTRPGRPIDEDWPLEPKWPYPRSKVTTEALIRRERGTIPAVLLRVAGVYDDTGSSIPLVQQMQRIYEKQLTSRVFPGDPSHGQAFVHLEDTVEAIELAVERRGQLPPEVAILIGEPQTVSYEELQDTFGRLIHGREWDTVRIPEAVARAGAWVQEKASVLPGVEESFIKPWMIPLADDHYELDITRARRLLGWEPRHSLRQALPKIAASLKADPLAWYRRHGLEPPKELLERAAAGRG